MGHDVFGKPAALLGIGRRHRGPVVRIRGRAENTSLRVSLDPEDRLSAQLFPAQGSRSSLGTVHIAVPHRAGFAVRGSAWVGCLQNPGVMVFTASGAEGIGKLTVAIPAMDKEMGLVSGNTAQRKSAGLSDIDFRKSIRVVRLLRNLRGIYCSLTPG